MIITPEIERLKRQADKDLEALGKTGARLYPAMRSLAQVSTLELLRANHPEADYADELYSLAKRVAGGGSLGDYAEAQALIAKIEGKNGPQKAEKQA